MVIVKKKTSYAVAKCHNQLCDIVQISEVCDQNCDRVSKNNKSCHICSINLVLQINVERFCRSSLSSFVVHLFALGLVD